MMKKRVLVGVIVFLFIIVVVILNVRRGEKGKKVEAEVAEMDSLSSWVRVEGTIQAENQVEIGAEVIGRITRIAVKEGDKVKKGEILCRIDPSTYLAKLAQARAQLRISQSKLQKAESDMERYSQLLNGNLISEEEYERVKTDYEILKAQVETGEFTVKEALENLNKTTLKSPIEGEVVGLNMEEGEMTVMGIIGTPGSVIMTIADRSDMLVRAIVDETEIVKVKTGQKAEVDVDAFPDTTFTGKVMRIGGIPTSDYAGSEQAVNFPVEVAFSEENTGLYPGMSATCNIIVASKDSALVVPYSALGRRKVEEEEKDVVFISEGSVARMRPVNIGITGDKEAEILRGISEGDTVLVGPYKVLRELEEGQSIRVELKESGKNADRDEEVDKDI